MPVHGGERPGRRGPVFHKTQKEMDMRNRSLLLYATGALALLALLAVPASPQTLTAGIDVWHTPNDGTTYVDFTDNPIAAGFFCSGSQSFAQQISLKGSSLVTSPSGVLGSTDTVIEREGDVSLSSGSGSTTIRVRAISFVNRSPISVAGCSDTFSAKVVLNGTASQGTMTISSGGTFSASFSVPGKVSFKNNTTGQWLRTSVTETVSFQTSGAPWADSVGSGGVEYEDTVSIDTDGDGTADYSTPGTTPGFAAGWSSACNPPCPVKVPHNGPHPTLPKPPPPPCAKAIVDAVSAFEADEAAVSEADASATASGSAALTEEADAVTVRSSTQVSGQRVTIIDDTSFATPCIAVTSLSTHVVGVN
jgi:hypothetical protein